VWLICDIGVRTRAVGGPGGRAVEELLCVGWDVSWKGSKTKAEKGKNDETQESMIMNARRDMDS
jgi:hypothetical protein